MPPVVLWWVWVAFVVINLGDLGPQSHDRFAAEVIGGLLVVTGLMYACAFRPRVISDDQRGLTVRNPFRTYHVPWGGVIGVYVGDSVEIECRRPAPRANKTVYSWALYSPRRSRARAEMRVGLGTRQHRDRLDARARRNYQVPDTSVFGKAPAEAKEMSSRHPSHIMARELARRCDDARPSVPGPGDVLTSRWDWVTIAAVIVPAAALAAIIAAG